MIIGLLKEPAFETRVSLLPEHISLLHKLQATVEVEFAAGERAFASDEHYLAAGASLKSRSEIIQHADIILTMNPLSGEEWALCKGKVLVGFYQALSNKSALNEWAQSGASIFSLDMLPRTTRAQSMDVLSSQANIAGYKAVILAAQLSPRYFPMFMTAAGSIPPAKVLILGAGVAGLQAIATAKRLGAVVEVFDTRPAVKEEVMSLGAKFVEVEGAADASQAGGYAVEQTAAFLQKQKARIAESVAKADIIITTAQIPGRKAPLLVTNEMLDTMRSGSLVIDLAASSGGNTEHTLPDETVSYKGVRIVGHSRLPGTLPADASKLYGKNVLNFLQLLMNKEGGFVLNVSDDLVKGTLIAHEGNIVHDQLKAL